MDRHSAFLRLSSFITRLAYLTNVITDFLHVLNDVEVKHFIKSPAIRQRYAQLDNDTPNFGTLNCLL